MHYPFPRARSPPPSRSTTQKTNDLEEKQVKTIKIKDYYGNTHEIPVTDCVYDAWKDCYREEDRVRHRESYHKDGFTDIDGPECAFVCGRYADMIDELIREEENRRLYEAIEKLTPIQQRRVYMFMEKMDYAEIARREKTSKVAVHKSLQQSFRKLRRLLEE